jgi:hypothetical protein
MDGTRLYARKLVCVPLIRRWVNVLLLLNNAGYSYVHWCGSLWVSLVYSRRRWIRESGYTAF